MVTSLYLPLECLDNPMPVVFLDLSDHATCRENTCLVTFTIAHAYARWRKSCQSTRNIWLKLKTAIIV